MKKILTALAALTLSTAVQAQTWSSCMTITGVGDFRASSALVTVMTDTDENGCTGVSGAAQYQIVPGQMGVDDSSTLSMLTVALAAYLAGKEVMLYHDNAGGPYCKVGAIAIGGWDGSCAP